MYSNKVSQFKPQYKIIIQLLSVLIKQLFFSHAFDWLMNLYFVYIDCLQI